jgi:hypothetical protein
MTIESMLDSTSSQNNFSTREPDGKDGVLGSFLALSFGMLESSVRASASVARAVTTESQKISDAMVQLEDQANQALVRAIRKVSESSFGLATDAINRLEHAALVLLSQTQRTTDRVAELAAQTSQATVGSRGLNSVPARA